MQIDLISVFEGVGKFKTGEINAGQLKELEDLRAMMESQRKSMVDREIREMTIRFQNERSSLQNQIRKCRELLDNRTRDI